jgi:hypothetical protein
MRQQRYTRAGKAQRDEAGAVLAGEAAAWPQVLQLVVVNRSIDPGSEFRLHRQWFDQSAMDVLLEQDVAVAEKDRLYRCLYRVLEHKQDLFVHLQRRWKELPNSICCCTT